MCRLKKERKNNKIQLALRKIFIVKTLKESHLKRGEDIKRKREIKILINSQIKNLMITMMMKMKKTAFLFRKIKIRKIKDLKIQMIMKKIYWK